MIELQLATDRPRLVREKMQEGMANGAQLTGIDSLRGEEVVEGFTPDLSFIWDPFAF